ncbi:transcriptional regulator [Sphingomonas sp. Leaf339]|uniref:Crp/Fnr family transcriptional regulator n=1 Tax=Sphingomonas sp. Leaf339 TaxID=1736343 RepID=UPI0006FB7D38|nr:Crp/Fnr family transcriptional regulator [Sphingomonas sp. Leaf339]KQU47461.1 transcriptional regulator [Sphingomonas sp. Leaf339]
MPDSCFADRIGDLIALTPGEKAALAELGERERRLRRNAVLLSENDRLTELFVLKQGMMMSYVLLDDGRRQILRFLFPGDFLATAALAYGTSPETLMALTDTVVSPFDRSAMAGLFERHPRLAAAITALEQIERVAMTDRLAAIGRTSAKARVAGLLLELRHRLRAAGDSLAKDDAPISFFPGITQEEIGDATGLTAVHVNRMLRQLEDDGLLARDGGRFTVLDSTRLAQTANYVDRYAGLDFGWLPHPR